MSFLLLGVQILVAVAAVCLAAIYFFYQQQFKYWAKRGIPHTKPSFPAGDLQGMVTSRSITDIYIDLYKRTKHEKVSGFWSLFTPMLIVNDPEVIKDVLIKDFNAFTDRGAYTNLEKDPLSGHLFALDGAAWRNLRVKLTPTFTSGKMKMMYPTIVETGEELIAHLKPIAERKTEVEVKSLTSRYTTDIISSCAFGIKVASIEDPNAIFRKMGQRAIELSVAENFKQSVAFFSPKLAKFFDFKSVSDDVEKFFMGAMKDTIEFRMKNNVKREDFLQLLMQLMDKGYVDDVDAKKTGKQEIDTQKFTFNEAAAQAFVFFVAGFETSSTTMQFALYELARNQKIQEKLRHEINQVLSKHDGKFTYEAVMAMEYLDHVVSETLRKFPPVAFLVRFSTKEYKIPNTSYVIEKGTAVHINVYGVQHDEKYYPDPEKFDPERFTAEEKEKRPHCVYLPFGDGPRNCIGNRFGLLQTKTGLALLIKHFKFDVTDKTPIPMKYKKDAFILAPEGGMNLRISQA